jgi:NAD(P)-dependent dehydrogenase (short-subunit alcohol dehydrogenase family)
MSSLKSIVVTGVSSGIGHALAKSFLKNGYRVFGTVRKATDAEPLSKIGGELFIPLIADVTDEVAVTQAAATVREKLNGEALFGLVNNAGISLLGPSTHQPMEEIRKSFDVNYFSVISVSRAFIPLLESTERPGRIVNISSVSGAFTVPFLSTYSATKHALEALTQGMRRELIPQGIHVAAIEPSFIKSKITDDAFDPETIKLYQDTPLAEAWRVFISGIGNQAKNAKDPEIVVKAVAHALESNKPKTRYPLHASWRLGRWLPDRIFDKAAFKETGLSDVLKR